MNRHELNTLTSRLREWERNVSQETLKEILASAADELERQRRALLSLQDLVNEALNK